MVHATARATGRCSGRPTNATQEVSVLRKIDCVMLRVDDLDAAVTYYQEVFHLKLHWRRERQAGLRMPETDAEIVLHTEADLPREATVHYLVDDVKAAVEQLVARGCSLLVAPFEIAIGTCAVLADPFGHALYILDMSKGPLPEDLGLSEERKSEGDPPNQASIEEKA
jgi:predicted enzyme related to lactoylglutathione lyase